MEELIWLTLAIVLFVFMVVRTTSKSSTHKKNNKPPPSPPSLPIIGHLYMIKQPLHKTLHHIATKYGEILLLRLGARNALLISSPSAVEDCLVKNDTAFANRPDTLVGRLLHYNNTSIAFSPYNDHFRTLKRVMTQEVFSSTKTPLLSGIYHQEVRLLLRDLWRDSISGATSDSVTNDRNVRVKVNLNQGFTELALNIMTNMVGGKRFYGRDVEDVKEAELFRELLKEGSVLSGAGNPGDFLPMLKFLFRGLEKKMLAWMEKTDAFYQRLLDERKGMSHKDSTRAVVDVLISLQLQDPDFFTNEVIKGMIMVLILAGSDTSASTMEWAMTLLLNHPEALRKAKQEVDDVVGHDRFLNEEDVSKLPYLQNVINEAMRLYPPTPLLLPHESSDDCNICGYDVPQGTMLMVSLWTIHRDPRWWDEPEKFKPERFEGKERDVLYKFLPFGLGRRACPGYAIGKRVVALVLGSILQCFEWERVSEEMIDTSQLSGLTMPKAEPLEALCKLRPSVADMLYREFSM